MKLSIVIVNYNSTKPLSQLISSLHWINEIVREVIVVDNASCTEDKNTLYELRDDNEYMFLIENRNNLGFSKAVNQGIRQSKSNYILLLNPDTEIIDKSITKMFNIILKDPMIGVIGGKIIKYGTHRIQPTANNKPDFLTGLFEFTNLKKIFPNNIFSRRFWIETEMTVKNPMKVDALCGAFMLFRKHINGRLNLFDENYFLYLEDVDFCLTNIKQKHKVVFCPSSSIKHFGGASSNSIYGINLKEWYKSRKYFFNKNTPLWSGYILHLIFSIEEVLLEIYHFLRHEPAY